MKHVFLVSQGEYDDYCVVGVWSTRPKAEKHAKEMRRPGGDKVQVEPWPVDVEQRHPAKCRVCGRS